MNEQFYEELIWHFSNAQDFFRPKGGIKSMSDGKFSYSRFKNSIRVKTQTECLKIRFEKEEVVFYFTMNLSSLGRKEKKSKLKDFQMEKLILKVLR
jgi:hypothetical protein